MAQIMNRVVVAALLAAVAQGYGQESKSGGPAARDGNVRKATPRPDEELLQGTWAVVSFEKGGRKEKDVAKGRVIINGAKLSLGAEGEAGDNFTFRLFPQQTPKGIDLLTAAEPKASTLGIYKIEGELLTLCVRGRGSRTKEGKPDDPRELTRPGKFSSEDGNLLLVLMRKKP